MAKTGFLNILKKRLEARHHAVVVVAEGAGQDLFESKIEERDASGNIKHKDIGIFLEREDQGRVQCPGISVFN